MNGWNEVVAKLMMESLSPELNIERGTRLKKKNFNYVETEITNYISWAWVEEYCWKLPVSICLICGDCEDKASIERSNSSELLSEKLCDVLVELEEEESSSWWWDVTVACSSPSQVLTWSNIDILLKCLLHIPHVWISDSGIG